MRAVPNGSESVGVCCPAFAPSLNWLPCILPKHTWFSVHMCALFQSESCDITLKVRTYSTYHTGTSYVHTRCTHLRTIGTYVHTSTRTRVHCVPGTRVPWYVHVYSRVRTYVRTMVPNGTHVRVSSRFGDHSMCTYTCTYKWYLEVPLVPWYVHVYQWYHTGTMHVCQVCHMAILQYHLWSCLVFG